MFHKLTIAVLAFLMAPLIGEAREIGGEFYVGSWQGAAFGSDTDGSFQTCIATASYNSGVDFSVIVGRSFTWSLGLSRPTWNLVVGVPLDLRYRIDNGPWLKADAKAILKDTVMIPMPAEGTLVTMFRQGHLLQVTDGTTNLFFNLTGTSALMARLGACVDAQLKIEQARSSPPAMAPSPPPSQTPTKSVASNEASNQKRTDISTGTGIVVSTKGHIVTNEHVIDGCSTVAIRRPGDAPAAAQIVVSDKEDDLALLVAKQSYDDADLARVRIGRPVPAGEPVAVYGFPLAGALSSNGNIVSGNITAVAGLADNINHFQISAPIQPGNSGGPLLDMHGAIIGVVDSKLNEIAVAKEIGSLPQNVNFAIKANVLVNFLEAHSVPYKSQDTAPDMDLPAVAAAAKKFTVLVVCEP